MIRETKKGRKGGNGGEGRKEREKERDGVLFYSYLVRILVDPMLSVITLE